MGILATACKLANVQNPKPFKPTCNGIKRKIIFLSTLFIISASLLTSCEEAPETYCFIDEYGDYVCEEVGGAIRKPADASAPGIK